MCFEVVLEQTFVHPMPWPPGKEPKTRCEPQVLHSLSGHDNSFEQRFDALLDT